MSEALTTRTVTLTIEQALRDCERDGLLSLQGPSLTIDAACKIRDSIADSSCSDVHRRAEVGRLRRALRIAHLHALQGGYGRGDGTDMEFVSEVLSDA